MTNITITMVEGLQTVLNLKLDKPTTDGNYFASSSNGVVNWSAIKPTSNYLLYWNDSGFSPSSMFRASTGKLGIGTTTPTEQLQLSERLRTKAVVLDENSETLPQQVTYNSRKFYGTDSTGVKRPFQYADYDGWLESIAAFTPAQKNEWLASMNSLISYSGSVISFINPPVLERNNYHQNVIIRGNSLNLPSNSYVGLIKPDNTDYGCVGYSLVGDNQSVVATFNIDNKYPLGKSKLKVINGAVTAVGDIYLHVVDSLIQTPIINSTL
ncbi:MAG: hypothetical protein EOO92_05830 [Pedobacter sp.]|nr:MAG: hypothetical protein EOO92_05830 [Pedobacter sp.]